DYYCWLHYSDAWIF
nr:immunoglobulin light chain junction region [Macaca mulatta]MOY07771.1 immunoglobulin light chain junction region [Macaca mulatta]